MPPRQRISSTLPLTPSATHPTGILQTSPRLPRFDPVSRYYLIAVSTAGWAPGVWTVRGTISGGAGSYLSWSFFRFTLDA